MSLQSELLQLIREFYPKEVPIDNLYELCNGLNHKQSTGERKLRILTHAGLITPIFTEKKAIKAYKADNVDGLYKVVPINEYVKSTEYKEIEKFNETYKPYTSNLNKVGLQFPQATDTLKEKIQNPLFEMKIPLN